MARPPGFDLTHDRVETVDHVSVAYTWWRRGGRQLLVLAPGFWRVRLARENVFLARHFLRRGYDVVALDFRGHGDSGGRYAFGAMETRDFDAVVDRFVGEGKPFSSFFVLGLSLGGSIAAQALAQRPELPALALAMVSSPADVFSLRPRPWKAGAMRQVRLRHALRVPRLSASKLLASRPTAAEAVARLAIPKLIVTSEDDWLVHPSHGLRLVESAAEPVEHVHLQLPGSLHADGIVKFAPLHLLRTLDPWFARHAPPDGSQPPLPLSRSLDDPGSPAARE